MKLSPFLLRLIPWAGALGLLFSTPVQAGLVTGSFQGTITSGYAYRTTDFGNSKSLAGRGISGTFSYDTTSPDPYSYSSSGYTQHYSSTDTWVTINLAIEGIDVPITPITSRPHEYVRLWDGTAGRGSDRIEIFDRNGYYSPSCRYYCYSTRRIFDNFFLSLVDASGTSLAGGELPTAFNMTSGVGSFGVYNYYRNHCYYCSTRHYAESMYGNFSLNNVRFDSVAVPEPGSFALLALGLLGLVAVRRQSQHR